MKFSPIVGGAVLVLLIAPLPDARADLIPWMYNWSRSPTEIHADSPGTGYIALTDEATCAAVGESDIVATNLKTFSTAGTANPDVFTARPFALYLFLQDAISGQGTMLDFTGVMNGRLTAANSNLVATPTGVTTRTVVLGGNEYTVTLTSYTPPGVPDAVNVGSIGAHVKVKGALVVENLPEPSSLVLAGLGGLFALGASRWRARVQRRVPE